MATDRPPSSASRPRSVASRSAWTTDSAKETPVVGFTDDVSSDVSVMKQKKEGGCTNCCSRCIFSIWSTRMTEDQEDQELQVKTTLRELVIYFIFIMTLCVITFGMTSSTMYYYTKVLSELFLDATFTDDSNTYRGMTQTNDFWKFAEGPLMDGLYWETWYNDRNVTQEERGFIYYENKILGVPRIRQLKVHNESCDVCAEFKEDIKTCYSAYSSEHEDKTSYDNLPLANRSGWYYQTSEELDGSYHWGIMSNYGGGGYVRDLSSRKAKSLEIIAELKDNLWLDRGTRAVFVDFTVYNANINLFCVIRLLVEFPATGGVIPSWDFRTVKLIRYVTVMDYFVLACECIFCAFILYYMIEEMIEISLHKLKYFKTFWNVLDIIVIIISLICIAFNVYRTIAVMEKLDGLLSNPDAYADFEFLSYWQEKFNSALAINVFFAWIKVFKYLSFNKTMTQLSSTLSRCAKDLGGFGVMFMIVFIAFAQSGYLIFGSKLRDFSTIFDAVFTLLRIILGDFNFHELAEAAPGIGQVYFFFYVFFVFFVLINMFLAIINDTYSEVKSDIAMQESEFAVSDYFKKGYERMLEKLNIRRDKIIDIQQALQTGDANNDGKMDYEEWRKDLKNRGYAEAEIEAVFAKYDTDGDRCLDADEQKKLQTDLEGEKEALDEKMEVLEDGARPGTSSSFGPQEVDIAPDDMGTPRSRGGHAVVTYDVFKLLARRVERTEHAVGSIVSKIDAVLVKLELMEKARNKRRDTMAKILDSINEGGSEGDKTQKMERMVRDELERWDSDSVTSGTSSKGSTSGVGSAGTSKGNGKNSGGKTSEA